jgi:hypothetical protein
MQFDQGILGFDFSLKPASSPLMPPFLLDFHHPDFNLTQQVRKILDKYVFLLVQLKHSFRNTLRTPKEYEESIREPEDGFFLSLYKLVSEGQMMLLTHLKMYFQRQRELNADRWGGYSKVPSEVIANLHCA